MPGLLQSISMFPYEDFWSIKGEKKVSHRCGGILTLVAFLILGAITFYQLLLVFQMNTITTSVQTQIDFTPAFSTITTFQNDPKIEPFMIAIDIKNAPDSAPGAQDYQVYAEYAIRYFDTQTSSYQSKRTPIPLENCTTQHFSKLPNITNNLQNWGMNLWYCLPLNRTFQIGGNEIESVKQIRLGVICKNGSQSTCSNVTNMAMVTTLYTLNTFINPQNNSAPYLAYLSSKQSVFLQNGFIRNFVNIDKNILKTDSSLTPISSFNTHQSYEISNDYNGFHFETSTPRTQFFIQRSGKTTISNRSYLKLLTALSFVGGLVAPIIAFVSLMFLTSNFGSLVFEMKLAKNFFNDKVAKLAEDTHYFRFIKQVVYRFLNGLGCKLNWQKIKKRNEIIKSVNRLMDVVYLHRRITFLERGITVLLEKHQLRGLYLLQRASKEETDRNYENHKLRIRINQLMASRQFGDSLRKWLSQKNETNQPINKKMFRKESKKQELCRSIQRQQSKLSIQKERQLTKTTRQNLQEEGNIGTSNELMNSQTLRKSELQDQSNQFQEMEKQQQEEQDIVPITNQQAQDIVMDFLKLEAEAMKKDCDPRSKRIYELLDKKMLKMLYRLKTE